MCICMLKMLDHERPAVVMKAACAPTRFHLPLTVKQIKHRAEHLLVLLPSNDQTVTVLF